jgi:hypothetical protein
MLAESGLEGQGILKKVLLTPSCLRGLKILGTFGLLDLKILGLKIAFLGCEDFAFAFEERLGSLRAYDVACQGGRIFGIGCFFARIWILLIPPFIFKSYEMLEDLEFRMGVKKKLKIEKFMK